jgi:thymidine phosphorylase
MALCAEMLVLGKLAATETEARAKLQASSIAAARQNALPAWWSHWVARPI